MEYHGISWNMMEYDGISWNMMESGEMMLNMVDFLDNSSEEWDDWQLGSARTALLIRAGQLGQPSLHQGTQQTFWDMEATQPEDRRITFLCPVL